jgi:hypothetical protein
MCLSFASVCSHWWGWDYLRGSNTPRLCPALWLFCVLTSAAARVQCRWQGSWSLHIEAGHDPLDYYESACENACESAGYTWHRRTSVHSTNSIDAVGCTDTYLDWRWWSYGLRCEEHNILMVYEHSCFITRIPEATSVVYQKSCSKKLLSHLFVSNIPYAS